MFVEAGQVGLVAQRAVLSKAIVLAVTSLGVVGCQVDEDRSPDRSSDRLPDNGLNPETPGLGDTVPTPNELGPISDKVTDLCEFEVVFVPRPEGRALSELRVAALADRQIKAIVLEDPSSLVVMRANLPLEEQGVFTVEITEQDNRSCYANVEVTSLDQDIQISIGIKRE